MPDHLADPLALSASAGARLVLAAALLGLVWALTLWAMAA